MPEAGPDDWRRVFPLALGGLLVLGIGDTLIGVAWPSVRAGFGQPLAALGELSAARTVAYLAASPLSGWLAIRLRTGPFFAMAALAGTAALVSAAVAPAWVLFVLAGAVYGLWAGSIDPGINAWMALVGNVRAMNLVHFAYGVGATVGPVLVTTTLTVGWGWRPAYLGTACLAAVLLVGYWLTRRGWGSPGAAAAGARPSPQARSPLPWGVLAATLATFFVYVGVEVAAGAWMFSHLVGLGTAQGLAGLTVSLYWGALTAGRLALAAIGERFSVFSLVLASCLVALAGAALFVVQPAGPAAVPGAMLLGLGLAGIFPLLMSLVPERVGAERTPHVVGFILLASSLGGLSISAGIGLGMQAAGVASLPWFLLAGAVVLLGLNVATEVLGRHASPHPGGVR